MLPRSAHITSPATWPMLMNNTKMRQTARCLGLCCTANLSDHSVLAHFGQHALRTASHAAAAKPFPKPFEPLFCGQLSPVWCCPQPWRPRPPVQPGTGPCCGHQPAAAASSSSSNSSSSIHSEHGDSAESEEKTDREVSFVFIHRGLAYPPKDEEPLSVGSHDAVMGCQLSG
jgi:hypothetical protein